MRPARPQRQERSYGLATLALATPAPVRRTSQWTGAYRGIIPVVSRPVHTRTVVRDREVGARRLNALHRVRAEPCSRRVVMYRLFRPVRSDGEPVSRVPLHHVPRPPAGSGHRGRVPLHGGRFRPPGSQRGRSLPRYAAPRRASSSAFATASGVSDGSTRRVRLKLLRSRSSTTIHHGSRCA
jgi:hypothetical protein